MLDPSRDTGDVRSLVLYHLWSQFSKVLIQLLRESKLKGKIPRSGGILAFIAGLSKCLVIRYEIFAETARLNVVAVNQNPISLFDFLGCY